MSVRPYQLECFDQASAAEAVHIAEAALATAKLEAYERGYIAGRADVLAEQAADAADLQRELSQQIQDLGFTYHEARQAILRSVQPVLAAMADAVLPKVMRHLVGHHIVDSLNAELLRHTHAPLRLRHHPALSDVMRDLAMPQGGVALDLLPDLTLSEGRFLLERGECEVELDLDQISREIRDLIKAHLSQVSERSLP